MLALRINVDGSTSTFDLPASAGHIEAVQRALGAAHFERHSLPGPMMVWTDQDIGLGHRDAAINYPATVALRRFGANTGHLRGPVAFTGGVAANGQVDELSEDISAAVEDFLTGHDPEPLPD